MACRALQFTAWLLIVAVCPLALAADEPNLKTVLGRAATYAVDYHEVFRVLVDY
jgi:hypothetical protein